MRIGLTGGIGSGKTTVAQFFRNLEVPVYDSDIRAKRLMETSTELKNGIKNLLGEDSYSNQSLNKTYIAEKVFQDKVLLEKLNQLVHPAVRADFEDWSDQQDASFVIQETALIFEIGSENFYDAIILVTAPEAIRIERVVQRGSGNTPSSIKARMDHQWSDSRKAIAADYVIENLDLERTKAQVVNLHQMLLQNR